MKHLFRSFKLTTKTTILFTGIMIGLMLTVSISVSAYIKNFVSYFFESSLSVAVENNVSSINGMFKRIDMLVDIIEKDELYFTNNLFQYSGESISSNLKNFEELKQRFKSNVEITLTNDMPCYKVIFFVNDAMPLAKVFTNSYPDVWLDERQESAVSFYKENGIMNNAWYQQMQQTNGEYYWFHMENNRKIVCMAKQLNCVSTDDAMITLVNVGTVFFSFDISSVIDTVDLSQISQNSKLILADGNYGVLYCNDETVSGNAQEFIQDSQNAVYVHDLDTGLKLITLIPKKYMYSVTKMHILISVLICFLLIIIGVILIVFMTKIIVNPINRLSEFVKSDNGLHLIPCEGISDDEIGVLYRNYNSMVKRSQDLIAQIYKTTEESKKAQLNMLQAQINPHFIYNVLDSICCVSLMRGDEDIARTLSKLANVMRYNIKDPNAIVNVAEELKIIDDFSAIQRFKYRDKFVSEVSGQEYFNKVYIPKMIIQPLVENALYHGMKYIEGKMLKIKISVEIEKEHAVIKVEDNSRGVDIDSINAHLKGIKTISQGTGGLGIRNVQQRIQMTFGDEYGLCYYHTQDMGVCAKIVIPLWETE